MNQMNSVIFEGFVDHWFEDSKRIMMHSDRQEDNGEKTFLYMSVLVPNERMAEGFNRQWTGANQKIRVVGRLAWDDDRVSILAEHIDYRP